MRKTTALIAAMVIVMTGGFAFSANLLNYPNGGIHLDETFGKMPLYFIENQGQLHGDVGFYVQGSDKTLYFTPQGITFALTGKTLDSEAIQRWVVKLDFVGTNPAVRPRGEDRQEAVISYFKGKPEDWKTGLPTYGRVIYPDLWPGIDLVYSGTVNKLKYEFVVKPGADPKQIRLAYRGATGVTLKETGELMVNTPLGGFEDAMPYAYQDMNGQRVEVPMAYALKGKTSGDVFEYGFDIGPYDPTRPLILDPVVLVYCGYIGGAATTEDFGNGIAVDGSGNAYVTGWTMSTQASFPVTVGPDLIFNGECDAYVAKVNATGTALVYCGYIGGTDRDYGNGIAVDYSGNAYVTGWTMSTQASFPVVTGPDLTHNGASDVFVAKVNAAGTNLIYCGYIGGTNSDQGYGIALDYYANACVSGFTSSTQASFPVTVGPDLTYNGGSADAFVAKVNSSGTGLVFCGYIGGTNWDFASDIAVRSTFLYSNHYVTGWTQSTEASFPVAVGPDLTYNGGSFDAFVAYVTSDGTGLVYCGYIGGTALDQGNGIAVGLVGFQVRAYVTGSTESTEASFPVVVGPDLTHNGSSDAFVASVQSDGTALAYCGYIGGTSGESGDGIAVDAAGNAYVTGFTGSTQASFPVVSGPDLTYNGGGDAFVAEVNAAGTGLVCCGYIGGTEYDYGSDIALDNSGAAYVTGGTESSQASFPVIVGPDLTFNGGIGDAFVAKVSPFFIGIGPTTPKQNELNVPASTNISVTFEVDMDETTINDSTFVVNARSTGFHQGTITYNSPTKTATLDPYQDFDEGELVTVVLTTDIQSSQGLSLDNSYVWSFTIIADSGSGTFPSDSVYPVGVTPYSDFAADLDDDGDLDLAAANYGSDDVSVLMNNGDGTFTPDSVYPVGDGPASVFAADLDGDGYLDLTTANANADSVSVLLNNGNGTFAPHSEYPVGVGPEWIFAADLNGDGDLDLVTANRNSDSVSVLLNNGDGTFAPQSVYPVGDGPGSVFAADLDGDGDLDLTTANNLSDNVSVLLNNGDGTFAPDTVYPAGDGPASVVAADLDADEDLDLAIANWSDTISVLLNNGNGTFAPQSVYPVGDQPNSIFAADLDGDGDIDLTTANYTSNDVSVLLNNGNGTFAPHSVYPVSGNGPACIFAADLNGDSTLDLATANGGSNNVSVLLNFVPSGPPDIVSTSPAQNQLNVSLSTNISVTFDIDMDSTTINNSTFVVNARSTGLHQGTISYNSPTKTATLDPDSNFAEGEVVTVVLTTGIQSSYGIPLESSYVWSFTTRVDDGSGIFALDSSYAVGAGPWSIFAARLDGDGDIDLATANNAWPCGVSVLLNNGNATFPPYSLYQACMTPMSIFAADVDGDGDLDLTTASPGWDSVSVLLNNGNGTFPPYSVYATPGPQSVFAADLDGDGDLDLAIAYWSGDSVSVLFNNGNGTFTPPTHYAVGNQPYSVFAADLDGDADLDLTTANEASNNVSVLFNNGNGTFAPQTVYPVGNTPKSVFAADLDGDSILDLATANQGSNNVSVLLNNGNGTFPPHTVYPVGNSPRSVFAADLDGDGDLDLTTANNGSDDISVLLNNGNGIFTPDSVYYLGLNYSPRSIFAADLDGDGDLDLATADFGPNKVSVLLNQNIFIRGDANGDGVINSADVVFLINYLFVPGSPAPNPLWVGDANCDGIIDSADVVYLINYLFVPGSPPPGCP